MKVTAFIGGGRKKKLTHNATEQFLQKLQSLGNVKYEIISLSDYHLETCRGCRACIDRGEEYCPLKDDRDILIEKIINSDGIIFSSPNYSFFVSARMKIFLDRLGYLFHRPHFFGKTFSNIVVQGIYGGEKIVEYFNFIGQGLGFNVVKGCCLTSVEPISENGQKEIDRKIDKLSKRFYSELIKDQFPSPSFRNLMIFRMARTSMKLMLDEKSRDYRYYNDNGWFESDYYYPGQLDPVKKIAGKVFDIMTTRTAKKNKVGLI